jgi:hypothetical protein
MFLNRTHSEAHSTAAAPDVESACCDIRPSAHRRTGCPCARNKQFNTQPRGGICGRACRTQHVHMLRHEIRKAKRSQWRTGRPRPIACVRIRTSAIAPTLRAQPDGPIRIRWQSCSWPLSWLASQIYPACMAARSKAHGTHRGQWKGSGCEGKSDPPWNRLRRPRQTPMPLTLAKWNEGALQCCRAKVACTPGGVHSTAAGRAFRCTRRGTAHPPSAAIHTISSCPRHGHHDALRFVPGRILTGPESDTLAEPSHQPPSPSAHHLDTRKLPRKGRTGRRAVSAQKLRPLAAGPDQESFLPFLA